MTVVEVRARASSPGSIRSRRRLPRLGSMSNLPILLQRQFSPTLNAQINGLAFGFELDERVLGGDEVPGDDRAGDQVQTGGADGLAVEGGEAELAVVAVEEEVVQGVHRLVLVELAADRLSLLGVRVVMEQKTALSRSLW